MWKAVQERSTLVRVVFGGLVLVLAAGMLLYLIPGQGSSSGSAADLVAQVGNQAVTVLEVQRQLQRLERTSPIPRGLESFYVQQMVSQLVFQRMLELEAARLGIRVTDQERAERIRQWIPSAFNGDTFVGMERYGVEVEQLAGMSVPEFEELVQRALLEEKFRKLVTDGVTVSPAEVEQEFRRRNEKIRIEYALIKPQELESKLTVTEAELASYLERNKARYVVPERRVVRYALLDSNQLRKQVSVSEEELRAYYNEHIDRYRIQNRVHASQILFKTLGKTDAEVEEIRKKAEEVLGKIKHGARFEELAKQYSEDATKDKGGDLGWIVQGQTAAEFERAAFGLPKGAVSDLVRTPYGFLILKVVDRENARTESFEEVGSSIQPMVAGEKAERVESEQADKISSAIRQSSRRPIDEIAKQFNLALGDVGPLAAGDAVLELGNSPELRDMIFRLRPGELAHPIRTDRGLVVLAVKEIQPPHPGTLAEVREKVTADFRREKAVELAQQKAAELSKRIQAGESMAETAKALGLEMKTSEPFSRTGTLPAAGSARQLSAAFGLSVGQVSPPTQLGPNWMVYRVREHQQAEPQELSKQAKDIAEQLLESKRQLAYEAFRVALEDRMKREGKLKLVPENIKRLGRAG